MGTKRIQVRKERLSNRVLHKIYSRNTRVLARKELEFTKKVIEGCFQGNSEYFTSYDIGLTFDPMEVERMGPKFEFLQPYQNPEEDIEGDLYRWIKKRIQEVPFDTEGIKDLTDCRERIPCFGLEYRRCTKRKQCPVQELCKEESSRIRAYQRHQVKDPYRIAKLNQIGNSGGFRYVESYENVDPETITKWKKSDRVQYKGYLKACILNDSERLGLEAADYFESKVKKIIRKPFYTVLGTSGDPTEHKNWTHFKRVGERIKQVDADPKQYIDALFHFSKSKEGYPPYRSLGSENASKKYQDYIETVVRKEGGKVTSVWEPNSEQFKNEQILDDKWRNVKEHHIFPNKHVWLFHGVDLGIGNLNFLNDTLLREKYGNRMYDHVKDQYLEVIDYLKQNRPLYLRDMNSPSFYSYIYQ